MNAERNHVREFPNRYIHRVGRRDWRDRVKAGDVLRSKRGTLRTVVETTYDRHGFLVSVTLPILRCSWTEAGYTVVDRVMLKDLSYRPTRAKASKRVMGGVLMRQLVQSLGENRITGRCVDCCDVVGVLQ